MRKKALIHIVNYTLAIYVVVWVYYAIFNWDVFSIKLNTNAGFSIIEGFPFVFFFLLGLAALMMLKYFIHTSKISTEKKEKDLRHRIAIMEKDLEILKMKETLFKMQSSEMGKNSSYLDALHKKLDDLSAQISSNKEETEAEEPSEENKNKQEE